MFGLFKKALPGAKERKLSPTETRLADEWMERAQSNQLNWEHEIDSMSDRQLIFLYLAFRYSVEKLEGRFLMPMERFGFLGMAAHEVDNTLAKIDESDIQKIRNEAKSVFMQCISNDPNMDLRGLIFDIKWKYQL
jgi:hypothetical protein